jgi:large subunit ribosomal protein L35
MPKMKTNSGAKKRFKKTGSGYKHRGTNRNHILSTKSPKRLRHLGGMLNVAKCDVKSVQRLLVDE